MSFYELDFQFSKSKINDKICKKLIKASHNADDY